MTSQDSKLLKILWMIGILLPLIGCTVPKTVIDGPGEPVPLTLEAASTVAPPSPTPIEPTPTAAPTVPPSPTPASTSEPEPPIPPTPESETRPERGMNRFEVYRHPDQGFGLILQNQADIFPKIREETNRGVAIVFPVEATNYLLTINARPAGTNNPIDPPLPGAVEPIIREEDQNIIYSLDQLISRLSFIDQDRLKGVNYVSREDQAIIGSGPIELSISLRAGNPDYEAIDIPSQAVSFADELVRSMWASAPYAAPSIARPAPDPSSLYSTAVFTSPDGLWTAETHSFNPDASFSEHQQLFVISDPSSTFELINKTEGWGLGVGRYEPLRWTDDALYFTYAPVPDGCGLGTNSSDLWRFTFATQTVEQIAPSLLFTSDVSGDGRFWAGIHDQALWVVDIEGNHISQWDIDGPIGGDRFTHINFNPSGNALLLVKADNSCGELGEKSIYRFNNQEKILELVTTIEAQHPVVAEWPSDERVVLEDILGDWRFEVDFSLNGD